MIVDHIYYKKANSTTCSVYEQRIPYLKDILVMSRVSTKGLGIDCVAVKRKFLHIWQEGVLEGQRETKLLHL